MIPKVIHYCWFGGAPKPKSVLRCISSWKKHCPDFEIREWTEKDFDVMRYKYTQQAYEAKAWAFVTDCVRLWIIYHHGGIYLDTDVQIIRNFSPLLEQPAFAGFEGKDYVALGLGFGAEPGNSFVYQHLQRYEQLQFFNEDGTQNKTAIPHYTTELLLQRGLRQNVNEIQYFDDVNIYPVEYFCPKNFYTGLMNITENTYSIHQYDASWFDEEQQKEKKNRWKENQRQHRKNKLRQLRYMPNRLLMKILGAERYEKIRGRFRRG